MKRLGRKFDYYAGIIKTEEKNNYKFVIDTQAYTQTYSISEQNKDVLLAQEQLNFLSMFDEAYLSVTPSGIFDKSTVLAVTRFQTLNELKPTGTLNKETWTNYNPPIMMPLLQFLLLLHSFRQRI